jgi:acetyl-CoA carboxylase biotin carboxyl carrier protein
MTDQDPRRSGPGPAGETRADPSDVSSADASLSGSADASSLGTADVSLLGLVDRLAGILDRSDLLELEIESGGTGLLLRKPAALAPPQSWAPAPPETRPAASPAGSGSAAAGSGDTGARSDPSAPARRSIMAPLTGLFYNAPTPGSAPYVVVGGEVAVGQVIGLIEAMKLFNEIKADIAGRVVRMVAENGALVKAKQALLELDPL